METGVEDRGQMTDKKDRGRMTEDRGQTDDGEGEKSKKMNWSSW